MILNYHRITNNNSSYHLLSTYDVPSMVLSVSHVLSKKSLTRSHEMRSTISVSQMNRLLGLALPAPLWVDGISLGLMNTPHPGRRVLANLVSWLRLSLGAGWKRGNDKVFEPKT